MEERASWYINGVISPPTSSDPVIYYCHRIALAQEKMKGLGEIKMKRRRGLCNLDDTKNGEMIQWEKYNKRSMMDFEQGNSDFIP